MSERSSLIHRLCGSVDARASYIKAKLGVLVPSQIRSLRLQSDMPRQSDLARAAGLHQSRISMFETPGAANMTLETLSRLAAAFKVGLKVEFVPFSELLRFENGYSQDAFKVTPIEKDREFIDPDSSIETDYRDRNADISERTPGFSNYHMEGWAGGQNDDSLYGIASTHRENDGLARIAS
jgi:transcriptional regulator with XRE-family HTH domain